jgi:hypothetical protein
MTKRASDPLRGVTGTERAIMGRLLRQPPERQKAAPKPTGSRAEAQRRRRQRERQNGQDITPPATTSSQEKHSDCVPELLGSAPTEEDPVLFRALRGGGFCLSLYLSEGVNCQTLQRWAESSDRAQLIRGAVGTA